MTTPTPTTSGDSRSEPNTSADASANANVNASPNLNPNPNLNLRDHLLAALSTLPGTREFHLHVLVTSPRKAVGGGLFPFAKPRPPRVYVQDVLVLCSELAISIASSSSSSTRVEGEEGEKKQGQRVIVSAIEATVYQIPSTHSAVFYVSKVDSTGHGAKGLPSPTGPLVQALLTYYVDPQTRPIPAAHIWIQLFARAQGQYLFPNSTEWAGKTPLGDVQLCAWWRRVLGRVVKGVRGREEVSRVGMYFVLPGFSAGEAGDALRGVSLGANANASASDGDGWVYGHPYTQTDIPLPCPKEAGDPNLGHYIPSFEDDPKSRFMEEIAYTTDGEIKSPLRKRAKTMDGSAVAGVGAGAGAGLGAGRSTSSTTEDAKPLGELSKVGVDEFWERMSFRQECVAGAVTGFFAVLISGGGGGGDGQPSGTVAVSGGVAGGGGGGGGVEPKAGEVSSQVKKRVMSTLLTGVEFSTAERAVKATETVEGAIRGLCDGIALPGRRERERAGTPEPSSQLLAPPSTPPRRHRPLLVDDASPNPFAEPVASLETYRDYIYGSVSTHNPLTAGPRTDNTTTTQDPAQRPVTVLTVRRKKKASTAT